MGSLVVGMEVAAVAVAVLAFGWPVLLVGVPLLVGTLIVLAAVALSEKPRRKLEAQRATRFNPEVAAQGGLMSGFFEIPRQSSQSPADAPGRVRR